MELEMPHNFDNKFVIIGVEIVQNLRKLIVKMKELELTDTGYTFSDEDMNVKIVEVCVIDDDNEECLSFAVEEIDGDGSYTVWAENVDSSVLNSLYSKYYANNISTVKMAIEQSL